MAKIKRQCVHVPWCIRISVRQTTATGMTKVKSEPQSHRGSCVPQQCSRENHSRCILTAKWQLMLKAEPKITSNLNLWKFHSAALRPCPATLRAVHRKKT